MVGQKSVFFRMLFICSFGLATICHAADEATPVTSETLYADCHGANGTANCPPKDIAINLFLFKVATPDFCASGLTLDFVSVSDSVCYAEKPANKAVLGICYHNQTTENFNCQKNRYYYHSLSNDEIKQCNGLNKSMSPCGIAEE